MVPFYLPGTTNDGTKAIGCIRREIHLVDNLRAKMLIGNDIIGPEQIVIDIANKLARVGSCYLNIKINACQRGQYVRRTVLAQLIIVPPYSEQLIPVYQPQLPDNRDFFFEPA